MAKSAELLCAASAKMQAAAGDAASAGAYLFGAWNAPEDSDMWLDQAEERLTVIEKRITEARSAISQTRSAIAPKKASEMEVAE